MSSSRVYRMPQSVSLCVMDGNELYIAEQRVSDLFRLLLRKLVALENNAEPTMDDLEKIQVLFRDFIKVKEYPERIQ